MIKKIIVIFIGCLFSTTVFATTVLYRVSSNEVVDLSTINYEFTAFVDSGYYAVLTDPTFSDGQEIHDSNGELRVFGFAKINDSGTVRNATQNEIDTFASLESGDRNQAQADNSILYFKNHPYFRRIMTAFAAILVQEINILRGWTVDYKAEVAAATSLADLKTRVAAMPTLNDRTLSQLKTAIENRISKND